MRAKGFGDPLDRCQISLVLFSTNMACKPICEASLAPGFHYRKDIPVSQAACIPCCISTAMVQPRRPLGVLVPPACPVVVDNYGLPYMANLHKRKCCSEDKNSTANSTMSFPFTSNSFHSLFPATFTCTLSCGV